MARKQKEIPGFERPIANPACEEAAVAFSKIDYEYSELGKKKTKAMQFLLATLKAHDLTEYDYVDEDTGEIKTARVKVGKETAEVVKTGEAESEVGEGVDNQDGILEEAAAAKKAQRDVNVETSDDGDVVVPETSTPKSKKKRATKPSASAPGVH